MYELVQLYVNFGNQQRMWRKVNVGVCCDVLQSPVTDNMVAESNYGFSSRYFSITIP